MPKEEPAISGEDFTRWMAAMGYSYTDVEANLGIGSRHTIVKFRRDGAPLYIALACSAIAAGLGPYRPVR
jgi:hypothetical protein